MNSTINHSVSALSNITGIGSVSLIIGGIVFVVILVTLFLLFRNVVRFIFGAVITGVLFGVYRLSAYIGVSADKGNFVPVTWFIYVVSFILGAIIIGYVLDKLGILDKIINLLDEKIVDENETKTENQKELERMAK